VIIFGFPLYLDFKNCRAPLRRFIYYGFRLPFFGFEDFAGFVPYFGRAPDFFCP
jgi:hypothetical protein